MWITFNPDLETDPTYQRFIVSPPNYSVLIPLSNYDNPWFTDVMEMERVHCQKTDPDNYENIWEGKCRPAVEGAIFYKEIVSAQDNNRICNVPYAPMLKAHIGFDLGHADNMAIAIAQKVASEIRIIDYIEENRRTLDYFSSLLRDRRYNWGTMYLPDDGKHADYKTGKTAQEIMQALGWKVEITSNIGVENGISSSRMMFHRIYFDKTKTERLFECLKRYRRRINRSTDAESKPLHDQYADGADCFRYICINADEMRNKEERSFQHHRGPSCAPRDARVGL